MAILISLLLVLSLAQIHLQTLISILKWLAWPEYRKADFMNFKKNVYLVLRTRHGKMNKRVLLPNL